MIILDMLILVWLHWFGDFACQINQMAINKSSSFKWLTIHVLVYSVPFILFGWKFALINFVLHWITDAVTSRVTSHYNKAGNQRMFFVVIGLDQAIHLTCLIGTYFLLFM